eukprot:CAMPEP_0197572034 /NCGR_PEP_ID=MMETSP1320-20131121/42260_1 /TAXON_ID=91990 /ORGANISM="Bolidomonas sp., Strain RCC2347" /LENGTH=103 /DNA_ID=CAMNT_0043134537 /DNA_START=775 /DNA_END=1086 /DNA_ORIENTATION=-
MGEASGSERVGSKEARMFAASILLSSSGLFEGVTSALELLFSCCEGGGAAMFPGPPPSRTLGFKTDLGMFSATFGPIQEGESLDLALFPALSPPLTRFDRVWH